MIETVHKYPFPCDGIFDLEMPEGALILTVQVQGGQPCIWARVYPSAPKVTRHFRLVGTGHSLEGNLWYRGTFQLQLVGGQFVFHLFEEIRA
jgi:hypothetical protein